MARSSAPMPAHRRQQVGVLDSALHGQGGGAGGGVADIGMAVLEKAGPVTMASWMAAEHSIAPTG